MDSKPKQCGCKGIRTCLLCENEEVKELRTAGNIKDTVSYSFCPLCNFCVPVDNESSGKPNVPIWGTYLGNIKVILEFLNVEEEAEAIAAIDQIPWMPSQSGRKKQDFGPKVNFKKKKGKVGDFKGFPSFSKSFIHKLQQHKELSNFHPVELCHLEYTPNRGSAIEPHIDDSWIWGERLVTINLASTTTLTLTPANMQSCDCSSMSFLEQSDNVSHACNHKLHGSLIGDSGGHRDMCSTYRTSECDVVASVQVSLPPRSLLVLAGCARYNWFHAIKREDITSRRLAMTFRELSTSFLINEDEKKLGEELLEIGRMFHDFNV